MIGDVEWDGTIDRHAVIRDDKLVAGERRPYLVFEDPPQVEEFRSYDAKGLTPRHASPRERHIYEGVSMFETEEQARKLALEMSGKNYQYIAEVSLPQGVTVERQGRREGHYNVYASPEDLKSWVVRVVRVR